MYQRVRDQPELRSARPAIVRLLREFAERAWTAGARYCACFVQPGDDGLITGSVTVSIVPLPPGVAPEAAGAEAVLDALGREAAPGMVCTVANLPHVGEVARCYGTETLTMGTTQAPAVTMQTFVPVPGRDQLALISGASPVLWLDTALLDLFDAVTGTFRWDTGPVTP